MNCPNCYAASSVAKTIDAGNAIIRNRLCPGCGSTWVTEETLRTGSLRSASVHARPPVATAGRKRPPSATTPNPSASVWAGGVGGGLPSGSDPGPDSGPSLGSPQEDPRAKAPKVWSDEDWYQGFRKAWCKAKDVMAYGRGDSDVRAQTKLYTLLNDLPASERAAAQADAPRMFAAFFARATGRAAEENHPFCLFVPAFNGLRATPMVTAATPPKGPESFAARDAREASERRARDQADTERRVAQTAATTTTCALHLYGERSDRKCNSRCPLWEGERQPADPIRELAEAKAVANG